MQEKLVRIQKYIADCGVCSRRAAEAMIEEGRVTLNGRPARLGDKSDGARDLIRVDGRVIKPAVWEKITLMLYKPRGYVTTMSDEQGRKCVADLIARERVRLYPVGRLDKDTEGLLLITNDGNLAHRLLAPGKHVDKVYYAEIDGKVTREDAEHFLAGVDIGDEKKTMPAVLEILSSADRSRVLVTIREGRFHQVKRMFHAAGKEVLFLKRIQMGPLKLDERLRPGEYRRLTKEEVEKLC